MAQSASSLDRINYVNIGLMVLSAVLAVTFPFELFLFAYAVLGPLHYMTEIGWLHQRNYFSLNKKDVIIPAILCVLITIGLGISLAGNWEPLKPMAESFTTGSLAPVGDFFSTYSTGFIFIAFSAAIFMVLIKNPYLRYGLMALMILPVIFLAELKSFETWFAVLLPTIIHVCVFTALFMLYGAMKSKSFSGYLSFGFFLLIVFVIFQFHFDPKKYIITDYVLTAFQKSGFGTLNKSLWEILAPGRESTFFLNTKFALKIQAFIAFSYTYHYLNWFSKTEVIKWHQVPRLWLIITAVVWVSSIGLYLYDYRTGLFALFFLSMLHVFLEFPLNIQSIVGIGSEGISWFRKPAAVAGVKK